MPIYEYVCQGCAHRFEMRQKFSDAPVTICARCGQAVTKLISAPAIMFKGSGWYVTDYSDKLKAPGQNESADKPNGQAEKSAEKSDQKSPASSTETASATSTPPPGSAASSGSEGSGASKPTTPNPAASSSSSSSGSSGKSAG